MKVLISDKMSPRAEEVFKHKGIEVDIRVGLNEDELIECIGEYQGLAVRSATKVTPRVLEAAKNLKVIGRAGIGVDNIDIPTATSKGVVVMNTPFGNSVTTAEHSIAMMLSLARKIPFANESMHQGKWEKSKFMGREISGKKLGIIGCGNIGAIVASRAKGLRMQVIAYDPFLSEKRAKEIGVEKVELDVLFKNADIITIHTPLVEATRHIINEKSFELVKPSVLIVNCARGGLVDEDALFNALRDKKIAGAALDVFEQEPPKDHPLFGVENVILTPHLGASTQEAQVNVAVQVAEQISDYLSSGAVHNALNMASLSSEDAQKLNPYLNISRQLGAFLSQVNSSGIESIDIEYSGDVSKLNVSVLSSTIICESLKGWLDNVNLVNAKIVAKASGIEISETLSEKAMNLANLIKVTINSKDTSRSVSGTIYYPDNARFVQIDGIPIQASITPQMLYVRNSDVPGFVGKIGTLLGDSGINIGSFHLGRNEQGGEAVILLEIDETPKEELLEQISKLTDVVNMKPLRFSV